MKRTIWIAAALPVALIVAAVLWWSERRQDEVRELALYGNVDLRQVDVAFNHSERIAAILVQEGERVRQGQLLARLDTSRLEPQLAQVEAQASAQRFVLQRLRNGTRPEEIAQARAQVEAAKAEAANARLQYQRLKSAAELSAGRAVRLQDVDNAKAALEVAEARLAVNEKALDLALAGPRKEEIAEAEARLRASEAQAALLRQQLADSRLTAPVDGIIRTRVMEAGEIASPQRGVFALAITDPKWVRVYVSETNLGKVHPGMAAAVAVDSFRHRRFEGWVGFISPVAEFTPKSVQTEDLRPSLVYEVRVFVKDPNDVLRLGMPATAYLPIRTDTELRSVGDKEKGRGTDKKTQSRGDKESGQ
jgi:HlyD family secretion protein